MKVGVDIIEIERIERALERPGFRERCFTEAEREYCDSRARPAQSYAGRFAGKEAVGKALGCGVRFTWKEIEIVGRPKPGVRLSGTDRRVRRARPGAGAIDLSMTHSREIAAAIAVVRRARMAEPARAALHRRRDARGRGAVPELPGVRPELMERAGPPSRTRRCSRSRRRAASRASAAAARTAATGASPRACCARPGTSRTRRRPRRIRRRRRRALRHRLPRRAAPEAAELIERMNAAGAPVVSVDLPSGVDASTGEVAGAAVEADLTVTFHAPKVGLACRAGRFHAGRVVVADIGLERRSDTSTPRDAGAPPTSSRAAAARDTKYSAGSVLVVGGQPGMTGAACLTALAALRADAGYVTLAVPEESLAAAEVLALEPVKVGWRDDDAVETIVAAPPSARPRSRSARGSGGATAPRARARAARAGRPPGRRRRRRALRARAGRARCPTVLTPHAGELGRLLGRDSAWVGAHRLAAAREAADASARSSC